MLHRQETVKHENLVLSTELMRLFGHRKDIQQLTFRVLALSQSDSLETSAFEPLHLINSNLAYQLTTRNFSANSYYWPIFSCQINQPHRADHHSFLLLVKKSSTLRDGKFVFNDCTSVFFNCISLSFRISLSFVIILML